MISMMDREDSFIQMDRIMKVNGRKVRNVDKAKWSIQMAVNILEIGLKINTMAMELKRKEMNQLLMANGHKANSQVEQSNILIAVNTKANSKKGKNMEKAHSLLLKVKCKVAIGKMMS